MQYALARLPLLAIPVLAFGCFEPPDDRSPTAPESELDIAAAVVGPSPVVAPTAIRVQLIAANLVSPLLLVQAPLPTNRRFIVDQIGLIRTLMPGPVLHATPMLDLRSRITPLNSGYDERGLLGLAFHPNFATNGRFFVFYTAPLRGGPTGYDHTNVISEFRANLNDPIQAIPGSERVLMQVHQPQGNHSAGMLAFGPDGYLYISTGDGGGRDDEGFGHVDDWYAGNAGGNGQDIERNRLGNILRINVNRGTPYSNPADNPFVGRLGFDAIWAYGFRNVYRFSFDMAGNRALYAADAGQDLWEEVSIVVKAGNYGWNVKEGTHCFDAENPRVPPSSCPGVDRRTGETLRDPIIEFANSRLAGGLANSVVGGYVYRGSRLPNLRGRYIFGGASASNTSADGRLFVATPSASGLWPISELLINGTSRLNHVVKGFGQDRAGEVYVTASKIMGPSGTTGKVFRIVAP